MTPPSLLRRLGRLPWRRAEPPLAVGGAAHAGRVDVEPIPQLAGDLLVVLVQALAVVGEVAAADEGAVAEADLAEPVGVGQRLPRGRHEVGLAAGQDGLGLI